MTVDELLGQQRSPEGLINRDVTDLFCVVCNLSIAATMDDRLPILLEEVDDIQRAHTRLAFVIGRIRAYQERQTKFVDWPA